MKKIEAVIDEEGYHNKLDPKFYEVDKE